MIRRLYVHNFRCLENFELPIAGHSSVLLIGRNGSGKTTVGMALEILQKIGRGVNRVGDLVKPKDFTRLRSDAPMRFEIEVSLQERLYQYVIAFELPAGFHELRVLEERLSVDGAAVYSRALAQVQLARGEKDVKFPVDWHLAALPLLQEQPGSDPVFVLKQWLRRMLILRPLPALISGESRKQSLEPDAEVKDFGAWFTGLVAFAPSAYARFGEYLKQVISDLKDVKNPIVGTEFRNLEVQFLGEQGSLTLPFADLSDGEKCFMICGLVLAANEAYGPLFCFWDEPDNYLAIQEVGDFLMELRRGFQTGGQFLATSHNPEAIRQFSDENILLLYRKGHLEPTQIRSLSGLEVRGDRIRALIRGDIEP